MNLRQIYKPGTTYDATVDRSSGMDRRENTYVEANPVILSLES